MQKRISDLDMYKANLAISTGFLALYFFFGHKAWLLYISLSVGALTLLIPALARWISFGWFKLAEGLGYVNSRILLSIVFFIFLLPIALLYRLANRNPLSLRNGRQTGSLFVERNHTYAPKDMDNIW
ncbi:SxtJ family membrane protein [Spirosoma aureum]|uniref:SxtJ family membrane protein n=1 Tax=Spirosoma aureum TaxID=2692134 RepID=UPI001E35200A|nr:SxtJ family membrane protein [Spirosoma aureum]